MDEKNMLIVLGNNLKRARENASMSKSQLVQLSSYNRQDLAKLEAGQQDAKLSTIVKLAKCLNVSLPLLFSRTFTSIAEPYIQDNYLLVFTENISKRINNGFTGIEICRMTTLDTGTLCRIMHHTIKDSRISTLFLIANSVGIELETAFKRIEEEKQ